VVNSGMEGGGMRYIIVLHKFWMDSIGFDLIESKATKYDDAVKEAILAHYKRNHQFQHCSFKIVEIEPDERLRRRLTWKERFTGVTNAT